MIRLVAPSLVALLSLVASTGAGESRFAAAALSAVVPGLGQAYLGWSQSAATFLAAEGAIWTGRAYTGHRAGGIEDDYVAYAAEHAGSDPGSRAKSYYDDISNFIHSERANQFYQDPYRYTGSMTWTWQSLEEMSVFRDMVRDRRAWDARGETVMALAILNRAVAVVYCLRANRSPSGDPVALNIHPGAVSVSIRW